MSRKFLLMLSAGVSLGACASQRAGMRQGFDSMTGPTDAVMAPPATKATGDIAVDKVNATHRQYYDKSKRRYYFFDPERKQYYWETGQPKR